MAADLFLEYVATWQLMNIMTVINVHLDTPLNKITFVQNPEQAHL